MECEEWKFCPVWRDFWLPSVALRHQVVGPLTVNDEKLTVGVVLNSRGDPESCFLYYSL